ncbi:hypothetical protein GCM10022213_09950 [Parerythrobacter jejuensis]
MASPALAQGDLPGPFSCSIGDAEALIYANEDGSVFSGQMTLAGDYAEQDTSPRELSFAQKYAGWRTVYENADMTLVIAGDSAKIYGAFGTSDCFASRSQAVADGWEGGWISVKRNKKSWRERPETGAAITWGGMIRSGPGKDFPSVGSVMMGRNVTVIARTDQTWLREYPWFKVRFAGGGVGYIAGGLLCTRDGRDGYYNDRGCEM